MPREEEEERTCVLFFPSSWSYPLPCTSSDALSQLNFNPAKENTTFDWINSGEHHQRRWAQGRERKHRSQRQSMASSHSNGKLNRHLACQICWKWRQLQAQCSSCLRRVNQKTNRATQEPASQKTSAGLRKFS